MSVNIRLTLAYDGTDYAGWQIQPDRPTIQGELEGAILRLTGETVRVLSAGRTDAGVHALGQVASFYTTSTIPAQKWRAALQTRLPPAIVILDSARVPDHFHATFSATSKRYRYVILNRLVDDPFLRRYVWRVGTPLDVPAMQQAAQALLGTHDFRSFETNWPNKASSVRTVMDLRIFRTTGWPVWGEKELVKEGREKTELDASNNDAGVNDVGVNDVGVNDKPFETSLGCLSSGSSAQFVCLEIEADGFLYNMVRAITGTLVNVGRHAWPPAGMAKILESQSRISAGDTAPAQGLYLVKVHYLAKG